MTSSIYCATRMLALRHIKVAGRMATFRERALSRVEDPLWHDRETVDDLRRAIDAFEPRVAGRAAAVSRSTSLRVKLDALEAGSAGAAGEIITCHRHDDAGRTRSVPGSGDKMRVAPAARSSGGTHNVKSPGRGPGLSFGADGFRAVRLQVTEPAAIAGSWHSRVTAHHGSISADDIRHPSSKTNKQIRG
jgi:hypothetical protein